MATVAAGRRAHINTAYFCSSADLDVYFLSDPSALHCRNLTTNPTMAITVFSSSQRWGHPDRGVQLFGTCREASARHAVEAERLYRQRFPAYGRWRRVNGAGNGGAFRYRFYHFAPRMVKILDERTFGAGVFVYAAVRRASRSQ